MSVDLNKKNPYRTALESSKKALNDISLCIMPAATAVGEFLKDLSRRALPAIQLSFRSAGRFFSMILPKTTHGVTSIRNFLKSLK